MNESLKAVLGVIALMGGIMAAFIWFGPNGSHGSQISQYVAMGLAASAIVSAIILGFVAMRKDKVPDYLRTVAFPYYHRDGLSFTVTASKDDNSCILDCYFQNRYSNECEAKVAFYLSESSYRSKYPLLNAEFGIRCPEAGFGRCRLPAQFPEELQGRPVTFSIAAAVRYPKGRGKMLRFKEGLHVGELKSNSWTLLTVLGALGGTVVLTSAAKTIMVLPKSDGTSQPHKLASTEIFWKLGDPLEGLKASNQTVQECPNVIETNDVRASLMIYFHLTSENNVKQLPKLQALHNKERGGSIVLYRSVMSLGMFTTIQVDPTWVAPSQNRILKGMTSSFPTLVMGWWSPEGFFRTVSALVYNFSGGCDITRLMTEPALTFDSTRYKQEILKVLAWEKIIHRRFLYVLCVVIAVIAVVGVCLWKVLK